MKTWAQYDNEQPGSKISRTKIWFSKTPAYPPDEKSDRLSSSRKKSRCYRSATGWTVQEELRDPPGDPLPLVSHMSGHIRGNRVEYPRAVRQRAQVLYDERDYFKAGASGSTRNVAETS